VCELATDSQRPTPAKRFSIARRAWSYVRRLLEGRWFPYLERVGLHATRVGFSSPIPDTRSLNDAIWQRVSELPGVDMREQDQLALLDEFAVYRTEYVALPATPTDVPYRYHRQNSFYGCVDAEMLYCMIRHFQPRRMIEIGAGSSTYLAAEALERNRAGGGTGGELTTIEPFPNDVVRAGFPGLTRLLEQPVQEVPLSEFRELTENDILFIESSHVLKLGSDVWYEFLEILPRLRPGVLVHVHDIFLPEEYPRRWTMENHYFWNEQYLLQAFLAFNERFRVVWAGRYMHSRHPEALRRAFPSYDQRSDFFPASFWMRRVS
jgi:hypothetical protein